MRMMHQNSRLRLQESLVVARRGVADVITPRLEGVLGDDVAVVDHLKELEQDGDTLVAHGEGEGVEVGLDGEESGLGGLDLAVAELLEEHPVGVVGKPRALGRELVLLGHGLSRGEKRGR